MKKIFAFVGALIATAIALQSASAYYEDYYSSSPHFTYDYNPFHNDAYVYINFRNYDDDKKYSGCAYWDDYDLKWRTDRVCEWIEKGDDFREKVKRARTVDFLVYSWDSRYAIASGRETGEVFSYDDGAKDTNTQSSTNWLYKEAYDPLMHGRSTYKNYYYEPRYDIETKTYNWRY